jgi:hypothetical protein
MMLNRSRSRADPGLHHYLTLGTPIPDHVLAEIVDDVALPLLRARQPSVTAVSPDGCELPAPA